MNKRKIILTFGALFACTTVFAKSFSFSLSPAGVGVNYTSDNAYIAVYQSQPELHCIHCGVDILPYVGLTFDWGNAYERCHVLRCRFCGYRDVYPIFFVPHNALPPPRYHHVRPLPKPRPHVNVLPRSKPRPVGSPHTRPIRKSRPKPQVKSHNKLSTRPQPKPQVKSPSRPQARPQVSGRQQKPSRGGRPGEGKRR